MKRWLKIFVVVFLSIVSFNGLLSAAEKDPDLIIDKSRIVLKEIALNDHKEIPEDLIRNCAGLAIIPGMIKGGFFVGGAYGEGIILSYRDGQWNGPAFIYTGGGSIGLQIGAEAIDLILVVVGQRAMDAFTRNKFRLGADVAFAVGPYGGQASAATGITFRGGIYSYSRSKGLFAGFSLEGAGIGSKPKLNQVYYGAPHSTEEILAGGLTPPASGKKLIELLQKFK